MIIKNKIENNFGNFGVILGLFLVGFGSFILIRSYTGIITITVGLFLALSYTSCEIDVENKKIKFANNIWGIIRIGKWFDISPDLRLGIVNIRKSSKIFPKMEKEKYFISLIRPNDAVFSYIKAESDLEKAKEELVKFAEILDLDIV